MSYDDDHRRHNPDRGAYTPPDEDDLPFRRSGGYDPRRAPQRSPVPLTLIVSAAVLLVLIVAVVLFYRSGVRSAGDAPPAVGRPVDGLTVDAPVDAQPIDPELGIDVYDPSAETTEPTFAPAPEAVQPRPEPRPETAPPPPAPVPLPRPQPEATTPPAPRPAPTPQPTTPPAPRPTPPAAGGSASVQIGAFSSQAIADREYAAVAAAFPSFASGRTKRVEQVQSSSGATVYRTTMGGFSRDQAQAFCAALRGAGRDCFVR